MEKKKQKELWKIEPKVHSYESRGSYLYKLKLQIVGVDKIIQFLICTDTSSCGSIQIRDLGRSYYSGEFPDLDTRKSIFDNIKKDYLEDSYNNIFFLDMNEGLIEKFFGDLGFKKVHSYGNLNTGNIVNFWIYDCFDIDTAINKYQEEDEEDDDYYED